MASKQKGRKIGRNSAKCQSYATRGTREANIRRRTEARERRLRRQAEKRQLREQREAQFRAIFGHEREV